MTQHVSTGLPLSLRNILKSACQERSTNEFATNMLRGSPAAGLVGSEATVGLKGFRQSHSLCMQGMMYLERDVPGLCLESNMSKWFVLCNQACIWLRLILQHIALGLHSTSSKDWLSDAGVSTPAAFRFITRHEQGATWCTAHLDAC